MSNLEKALSRFLEREPEIPFDLHDDLRAIIDAARRFASLTSPETWETKVEPMLSQRRQGCCSRYRKPCGYHEGFADGAEAVLRSVEEGTQ